MKRLICLLLIFLVLLTVCSCNKVVTYVRESTSRDEKDFSEIIDIDARIEEIETDTDTAVFHTYEELKNVSVNIMEYNTENDEYLVSDTAWDERILKKSTALRIKFNNDVEYPYVMIEYERKNGEKRQQFLYRQNGKLWLLERE